MTDGTHIARFDIERCNNNTWDSNLSEINAIYAEFDSLGIPTVSASRINSYRDAFQSLIDAAHEDRTLGLSLAVRLLNANVEFHQLRTILRAARWSDQRENWKRRLSQLISGAELPTNESDAASARDFQFESFVGAVCELSGYGVQFDEPDLVISGDGGPFGIAAKRPRNDRKVEKHCKKAIRQIRKSGMRGLIALDVSFAFQADQCINTNDLYGGQLFVESVANGFIHDNHARLKHLCAGECVLGVLVHVHMPVINYGHPNGTQIATAIRWTVSPFFESELDGIKWAVNFSKKCEIGLFGPRESNET